MSEMMKEVMANNEKLKVTAQTGEGGNPDGETSELPEGASPLEASETAPVAEEAPAEGTEEPASAAPAEEETLIRIGTETFKTQREAIAYAEQLEREKLVAESYNQGIRDTLNSNTGTAPQPEPEDNFEERFYANPKETLKEVQAKARDEAIAVIRAENQRENLWTQFLTENPDIRRKDAERVLNENWDTIGKMTDLSKAMKVLAQRTRAEYEEIRDLMKPRTELSSKRGPASPSSGGTPARVTPEKKTEAPLSFAAQLKSIKRQG